MLEKSVRSTKRADFSAYHLKCVVLLSYPALLVVYYRAVTSHILLLQNIISHL